MPSFDIVSKIDQQELDNAVNSVLRELTNRYDFKGAVFSIELNIKENLIILTADSEYKINAIGESLRVFATKRNIDIKSLEFLTFQKASGNTLRQEVKIKNGIDSDTAKKIVKHIKDAKLKIQSSIKGEEIRVDGKKRDDLQEAITYLKNHNFHLALQFINFRD
jgi:uncharacterized protein YajQ (UPF0234 family)